MYIGRPGYLVLEFSSKDSYGVFSFQRSEDYTLCLTAPQGAPENLLADASIVLSGESSITEPALLVLGRLGDISYIEKTPVW